MTATHAGQIAAPADGGGLAARARTWVRATTARAALWNRTVAAKAGGAPIGPAERVLTSDCPRPGSLVLATTAAVYCQNTAAPDRTWSRLRWDEVIGVVWDERRRVLKLTGVGPAGLWRKDLAVPSQSALAEVARERVTSTLLATVTVRLDGRVCAWVTARRQPGSGTVGWVIVLNSAEDNGSPAIRAAVAAAMADLRAQTGIPAGDHADAGWPLRQPRYQPGQRITWPA